MLRGGVLRGVRRLAAPLAALAAVAACSGSGGRAERPPASPSALPSASFAAPTPGSAAPGDPLAAFTGQRLTWTGCGGGAQCASLRVPVDYARPAGATIQLALLRHRATGKRSGSLVVNPGGPGGSGVDYARSKPLTAAVRAAFDIVGFDPRGVGRSAPIRCADTAFLDRMLAADAAPGRPDQERATVALARQYAELCRRNGGPLLAHVATSDVVRDLDVLRAALGDDKLTYVGKSYGTFIGALYAQRFPTRVRALVLDGAVDPALPVEATSLAQARGFETALQAFLADCVARPSCPLGGSLAGAQQRLSGLLAAMDRNPLPAPRYPDAGGRRLTESLGLLGVASALYAKQYWVYLRDALAAAVQGDGSGLLNLGDDLVGRSHGQYSNQTDANTAVSCLDHNAPRDPQQDLRDAAAFQRAAPHFGAFEAYGSLACAFWPVPPARRDGPLRVTGAPPIVVVGTTRDPATPYAWAVSLTRQLGSGVLVTRDGDGHTAYGEGDPCLDRAVDAYLLDRAVPAPGLRC